MASSTPSGIVSDIDSADIMSPRFIGFEPIHTGTYFNVVKAQRYGQWWALKYLREEHRDNNFFRNLLQKEYRIATRLNHPSIVRVVSLENVQPYGECIVMEYIDGVTLDKMPATSASRRYELMQQLVSAVASMHSLQIVHRDIKPHNIIVTNNGRNLRLIDLGLADADNYAVLKQPAGTDGYISPEQRTEAVPDAANDVYSLGVILKEQHLGWQFAYTVSKCLRPAARRYSDATQLGKALERARRIPAMLTAVLVGFATIAALWVALSRNTRVTHATPPTAATTVIHDTVTVAPTATADSITALLPLPEDFASAPTVSSPVATPKDPLDSITNLCCRELDRRMDEIKFVQQVNNAFEQHRDNPNEAIANLSQPIKQYFKFKDVILDEHSNGLTTMQKGAVHNGLYLYGTQHYYSIYEKKYQDYAKHSSTVNQLSRNAEYRKQFAAMSEGERIKEDPLYKIYKKDIMQILEKDDEQQPR